MIENSNMNMFSQFIDDLTQAIGGLDSQAGQGRGLLKSVISSQVGKLDLVSRDEFESQTALLAAMEEKVKVLEAAIETLERSESPR